MRSEAQEKIYEELSSLELSEVMEIKNVIRETSPAVYNSPTMKLLFELVISEKETEQIEQFILGTIESYKNTLNSDTHTEQGNNL